MKVCGCRAKVSSLLSIAIGLVFGRVPGGFLVLLFGAGAATRTDSRDCQRLRTVGLVFVGSDGGARSIADGGRLGESKQDSDTRVLRERQEMNK